MEKHIEISEDCRLWVDQECVHLKAVDPHGDPVELTKFEAVKLANALLEFGKGH